MAELRFDAVRIDGQAELAVTVEHPWQDEGVGTELLRRAIILCRNRAIRSIYMLCLLDNRRVQHIARKFEGALSFADGAVEAEIALPYPTQFTLAAEALDESASWLAAWRRALDRVMRGAAA